jgi:hypothetical protein
VLLAMVIAVVLWQFSGMAPRRRLAVENFAHVRMGMTLAEVEALLGGPPGNYGRFTDGMGFMTLEGYISPPGAVEQIWCDDANRYEIYFDADGRVVGHHRRAGYSQEPGDGVFGWLRRITGL